jgi:predicted nucleotide-binding protein (sugar kinase/HSP70/actin superfamily)
VVPIDYDPSATKVNQENRLKLMLATARDKLAERQAAKIQKEADGQSEVLAEAAITE